MVRYLFGFVALIALVLIGTNNGLDLWKKYKTSLPNYVLASQVGAPYKDGKTSGLVLTVDTDRVRILSSFDEDYNQIKEYAAIPYLNHSIGNRPDPYDRTFFIASSSEKDPISPQKSGAVSRICSGKTYSNIDIYDFKNQNTKPVFENNVLILDFAVRSIPNPLDETTYKHKILIEFIANDTNEDNRLSCNDYRDLAIYNIQSGQLSILNLDGTQPQFDISKIQQGEQFSFIGMGQDENNDGYFDVTQENSVAMLLDLINEEVIRLK